MEIKEKTLYEVRIAQADSGVESQMFWDNNYYYDEYQFNYPGITKFGKALIDHTLTKTEKAKYGIKHAVGKHWVKRKLPIDTHVKEWIIYDIFVKLDEQNYVFWKLKYP